MARTTPRWDVIRTIGYEVSGDEYLVIDEAPYRKALDIHNGGDKEIYLIIGGVNTDIPAKLANMNYVVLHPKEKWHSVGYVATGCVFVGLIDNTQATQISIITDSAVLFKRDTLPLMDRWDDNRIYSGAQQWQ